LFAKDVFLVLPNPTVIEKQRLFVARRGWDDQEKRSPQREAEKHLQSHADFFRNGCFGCSFIPAAIGVLLIASGIPFCAIWRRRAGTIIAR